MRYRLMATYRGVPYEAGIGPSEADVVLFAACPPPEELDFEPATGHWRKQLRIDEVQALWESKPTGKFRGERCIVLDDLGDRLHIAYLGHDAYQAEKLGYWQVDRGVFELVAPREEVVDIVEERTDYPGRTAGGPPSGDKFSASPVATPPVADLSFATPPVADLSFATRPVAGPPFTGPSAADPPSGTAPAPWPGGTGAAQPPAAAAPRLDEVSTKLADLAAATLAHLATMSHAPVRDDAPQEPGRVPARDLPRAPATDLPRLPAQDPAPYPAGLQSGRPGGSANGVAVHPVDFPVPAGPGNWSGSAPEARISMPPPEEEPLPLEAAARRAASAATAARRRARRNPARPDQAPAPDLPPPRPDTAPQDRAAPDQTAPDQAAFDPAAFDPAAFDPAPFDRVGLDQAGPQQAGPDQAELDQAELDQAELDQAELDQTAPDQARSDQARPDRARPDRARPDSALADPPRRRRTGRMRVATQGIFSELAGRAAIPPTAYAVGAEVDGAMCLIQTGPGFEVFNAVAGTRHEVRSFQDEESAYFYLFGVLAADAVRTGRLMPGANGESAG